MKTSKFLCVCLFGCLFPAPFGAPAHDIRIAKFELVDRAGSYSLFIRIDSEDIFRTLEEACENFDSTNEMNWGQNIESYIQDHFRVVIDGHIAWYELTCIEYEPEFVLITGRLQVPAGFSMLEVYNTCLVSSIEDHSNIVSIKTDGQTRAFRLHKGRTSIRIEY